VGFTPNEDGESIIVEACDREEESVSFSRRSMKNNKGAIRPYRDFSEVGEGQLITKIQRAISDGYRFKEVQRLLK
jgi:hypothetical protein